MQRRYLLSLWRWVSNQNTSLVILLHWRFQLLPCSLKPNFRVSFPHQCCITVSRFFLFFVCFCFLIYTLCLSWCWTFGSPKTSISNTIQNGAQTQNLPMCILSVRNWVTPLGHVESSKSQCSVVVAKLCSKRSLFRTIECMINAKITSLDISSSLSWLVRQGIFHLRAGRLNLKLKGPLCLTTN